MYSKVSNASIRLSLCRTTFALPGQCPALLPQDGQCRYSSKISTVDVSQWMLLNAYCWTPLVLSEGGEDTISIQSRLSQWVRENRKRGSPHSPSSILQCWILYRTFRSASTSNAQYEPCRQLAILLLQIALELKMPRQPKVELEPPGLNGILPSDHSRASQ